MAEPLGKRQWWKSPFVTAVIGGILAPIILGLLTLSFKWVTDGGLISFLGGVTKYYSQDTSRLNGSWTSSLGNKAVYIQDLGNGSLILIGDFGALTIATYNSNTRQIHTHSVSGWESNTGTVDQSGKIRWEKGAIVWSR